ncbi:hypothetical protein [Microvirga tunisiensis]|uniref:Uncharacterized protein n=1 Tax=Microvirga tunisiensis TaxID=2108360 RepID=A0A5N7MJ99_9HYPH|nr:hypothetical protein [Microvirga tunisiensis]MPR08939.1 hypothetical protein [Microvirga tunisiensis]MPR27131.1 hypothetical protein [Microvirga tunisiensis]
MQVSTQIADREFTFFTWRGKVRTVLTFGRGSRTREILIQSRDGTRRTIRVQPSIRIEPDHEVSLVYARRSGLKNGVLVGLLDHTSDRHCSMPQGYVPIRLKPSLFVDIMKDIERYSFPGTAFLLTVFAAACMLFAGVTYPLLTWLMIGSVLTVLLWSFNELAKWQSETADNLLVSSTEEFLEQLATAERIANSPEPYDSYGATWVLEGKKTWTAPALEIAPSQRTVQTEPYKPRSGYGAF